MAIKTANRLSKLVEGFPGIALTVYLRPARGKQLRQSRNQKQEH